MRSKSKFDALLSARIRRAVEWEAELVGQRAELGALRDADNDDEHDPDGVPVSAEWSRIEGLLQECRAQQAEIHAAKHRLERGEYGICEGCGELIDEARLEIRPMARRCVGCGR